VVVVVVVVVMTSSVWSEGYSLLRRVVLQAQPLVQLPLSHTLLGQPPTHTHTHTQNKHVTTHVKLKCKSSQICVFVGVCVCVCVCVCLSHQVLVPGLAQLDQVRLDAVHLLVDLPVIRRLRLQLHL